MTNDQIIAAVIAAQDKTTAPPNLEACWCGCGYTRPIGTTISSASVGYRVTFPILYKHAIDQTTNARHTRKDFESGAGQGTPTVEAL